jgi:hypothetical protein
VRPECTKNEVGFGLGRGLTHCLAPAIVNEDKLGIPAFGHSEFPSDAIGGGFPRARDESVFAFHCFDLLNACGTDQQTMDVKCGTRRTRPFPAGIVYRCSSP